MPTTASVRGSASRTRSLAFVGLSVALMAVSAWVTIPLGPVPFTLQIFVLVLVLLALNPGEALASIACYLLMGAVGLPVFSSMRGGMGVLLGPTGGFLWGYLLGGLLAVAFLKAATSAWQRRMSRDGRAAAGRRAGVGSSADEGHPFGAANRASAAQPVDPAYRVPAAQSADFAYQAAAAQPAKLGGRSLRTQRPLAVDAMAAVVFLVVAYACGWLQLMPTAGLSPAEAFAAGIAPFIVVDAIKIAIAVPVARAVRSAVG